MRSFTRAKSSAISLHPNSSMSQHVAACCSALQYVAVCCNVLQCCLSPAPKAEPNHYIQTLACCSVLQRVAGHCSLLQRVAMRCNVLQYVAVCCSMLQHDLSPAPKAAPYRLHPNSSMSQHVAACCSALQCVAVCCSVLQRVAACCSADFHLRQKQSCIITTKLQCPFNWSEAFIVAPIH